MTLQQNLEEEADKKQLTGEERHRFIGGTIHTIEARKGETPKQRKHAQRKEPHFEGYINQYSQHIKPEEVKARYEHNMADLDRRYGPGKTYTYDELVDYVNGHKVTKRVTANKSERAYALATHDKPLTREQLEQHKENVKKAREENDKFLKKYQSELEKNKPTRKPVSEEARNRRNEQQRARRIAEKQAEEQRKQNARTVTVKQYTDSEIAQFQKQLAANNERIKHLQEQHDKAIPNSYQQFKTSDDIGSLKDANDILTAKIHATLQTSYARYKSHYANHTLIS